MDGVISADGKLLRAIKNTPYSHLAQSLTEWTPDRRGRSRHDAWRMRRPPPGSRTRIPKASPRTRASGSRRLYIWVMSVVHDHRGMPIRLSDERMTHILEHPEMSGMEAGIPEALRRPDFIIAFMPILPWEGNSCASW